MHQPQTAERAFHHKREVAEDHLLHEDNRYSSMYQTPPISEHVPSYLFALHSPFVL